MGVASTQIRGRGTGRRTAVGPVAQARPLPVLPADEDPGPNPRARVLDAFDAVRRQLLEAAARARGTQREVIEVAADMASDPMLVDAATERVDAGVPPARAVHEAVETVCVVLEEIDGLMAERVTDVRSVGYRVIAELLGLPTPGVPALLRPSVVVAEDLAPADTAGLDVDMLLALVTERGGPTGHTAIIAGQLGIPCIVQAQDATLITDGTVVAVDAASGSVIVNPAPALVETLARREQGWRELAADHRPGATNDGHRIALLANVGTARDAHAAASSGAEGVGLFRTEVMYLDRHSAPSLEEQIEIYVEVFGALDGAKVVVRTLDAGADKPLPFLEQEHEANPALGVRGYRLARTDPELLDTQLRAIAEAARRAGAHPWVMAPMVSVPAEAADFALRARAAGIEMVGAMIEVPAAALLARQLLAPLDFVSLGTNDLAQYTMGADRLQHSLSDLLDPWQPAVLRLVAETVRAGVAAGKPVGVCGESASDPAMSLVLAGLGISSLSMSSAALPDVRYALRAHTLDACRALADRVLAADDARTARAAALDSMDLAARDALALHTQQSSDNMRC
jgi:phosphoenolpyruvate-protein phosphotransferase (PTS system enzyme I)